MYIMQKIPVIILLIISATGVILGDFFAKYWSLHQRTIFYVIAIAGYLISSIFYIPTLLRQGLVVTSVIWSLLSIVGFLVIGLIIFKEPMTPLQMVGAGLGVLALVVLAFAMK
jgi:multidrug transporter EmrE-like cation transporter